MAYLMLSVIGLLAACAFCAFSGRESGHFPLDGCSTNEMDVLCLFFNKNYYPGSIICSQFFNHLLSFPHNKTTPRVLFAAVYDWFSVNNPNRNVSSWQLHTSAEPKPYGYYDQQAMMQDYNNVNETIELKVKFVQHLFKGMGGVRENVTHIAVIFIDGNSLSFDEMRTVPHILQQQDSGVKVFAVVTYVKYENYIVQYDKNNDIVHLRDTLLVDSSASMPYKHLLALAMCNQCLEGWWKFEHNVGTESISCYKMFKSDNGSNNEPETFSKCTEEEDSYVVTIESRNELTFLQTRIYSHFNELGNRNQSNFLKQFFIGLYRNRKSIHKIFHWRIFGNRSRPLVVNKWMPGKPSGGFSNGCAVWQFEWRENINDVSNVSINEGRFVDGWADVDCLLESSFTLCEVSMSRKIEDNDLITIKPATNQSFSRALNIGGFVKYKGNIVSVSYNSGDDDFVKFLQQTQYETFPLFDCGADAYEPRFVSYSKVCDGDGNCANTNDEVMCWDTYKENWELDKPYCPGIYCCDGSCLLLRWVNDGEVDCPVCDGSGDELNDESDIILKQLKGNNSCAMFCNGDTCVHLSQLNDGHIDCTGWDGPLDETLGKLETADTCHNQNGHSIWAPRCVYVLDGYGSALGCRDMSHLENCTDFECSVGYFKCPSTYCIPQHYVLDKDHDCPTGEDEQIDNIGSCTGYFACWGDTICLYPDLVCDGYYDCRIYGNDEVDCDFKCVEGFRCVSGTITVSSYNKLLPLAKFPSLPADVKYMDMSGVDLSVTDFNGVEMPEKLTVVKWSNCKIQSLNLQLFFGLNYLQHVDLSYNRLQKIDGRDFLFPGSKYIRHLNFSYNTELVYVKYLFCSCLEILDLSHTGLSHLDTYFLKEFTILKYLNLSFTFIASFHKNIFPSSFTLQTIDLRGLAVDNFYGDFFNGLTISQHLYTDSFEMCCPQVRGNNIPEYTCHAPVNSISSCFDLIGVNVQRVLLWVVAVLAVLGNAGVIIYRLILDRPSLRTGYGLFVTNLGISDFIMGVYLLIIAGADYYYRDIYVLYDRTWRESITCRLAGFLVTLSGETSIFFIFFITLDRFLIMKFPFGQVKFSKLGKIMALLLSWIIAFLLAVIPIVFRFEIYSSNAMCLGLPLTTKRLKGWEFSFGVFIVLNFFLCFVLAYGQRSIFRAMSDNRISQTASNTSPRRVEDILVAKQLSLVALFNFLCWFPIGFMGFLSLGGHEISNDVYGWITVIVLPINSAANPFLYTIPVLMDKWDKFRPGGRKYK